MLRTALAYLGAYICKNFNFDYQAKRVRMCDREHLISEVSKLTDKLELPMVSYCLEGTGLMFGPRSRGRFIGETNTSFNEAVAYEPIPIRATIRIGIVCRDEVQSLECINSYFRMTSVASFNGIFHHKEDNIPFECGLTEFEDLTVPPAGIESRSYEEKGLLYSLDGGFTLTTNLLYDNHMREMKLIRASNIDFDLINYKGETTNFYTKTHESVGTFITKKN